MASKAEKQWKVGILATHGFEQVELEEPRKALEEAGIATEVIAPKAGEIKGWNVKDWGTPVPVDVTVDQANVDDYDLLLLPGGVMNPDYLRLEPKAISFIRAFGLTRRPIAAICHGPWTLIDAGLVEGKKITSWPSLKTDLRNAGADWVDAEVVEDQGLITSRKPDDIPAFNSAILSALEKREPLRKAS